MQTKMMKFVSITALLIAATFWSSAADYQLGLRFLVSLGAFLVARQALRAEKRLWAAGFFAITLLFNPFLAVITFTGKLSLFAVLASAVVFAVSLTALKPRPLLSIPSITDRTPGSESL